MLLFLANFTDTWCLPIPGALCVERRDSWTTTPWPLAFYTDYIKMVLVNLSPYQEAAARGGPSQVAVFNAPFEFWIRCYR